ncbi:MAG: ABC transporter permease [Halobacteriales archaeon]
MSLLRYTVNRLLQTIPVVIGLAILTFLLVNSMPGNPVDIMLAQTEASPELIERLEQRYGLDRPIHERFVTYAEGLVQGDLGHSIYYDQAVTTKIAERMPVTILLVISSFTFAILTAIPLGVIAAKRRNKPTDHISRILALVGVSTPSFWIGLVLIIVFAYHLGWFPSSGLYLPWRGPEYYRDINSWPHLLAKSVHHLIMPTVSLGTLYMATIMRIERAEMVNTLQSEYIKLARAYGVSESRIMRKHAFRVSQLPVVTIIGLNFTTALGGAVLTETVFSINGMGRLIITAIRNLDYQLVLGTTIVFGLIFVIGVIITDLSYAYIDPRVSYGEEV